MGVDFGFMRRYKAAACLAIGQAFTLMASHDDYKTAICDFTITDIRINKFGDEVVVGHNGTCGSATKRSLAIDHILDGGWRVKAEVCDAS